VFNRVALAVVAPYGPAYRDFLSCSYPLRP
jgi:hypothetical protein